ncbi:MAG: hypothetical protein HFJ94_01515 [Muribaculaceae bacterium]|nr:hypothetical protein [Muribaculaceae bacterium]
MSENLYTDSFSLRRTLAFGKIFSPWIGRQLLFMPLISLAVAILTIVLATNPVGTLFCGLLSFVPAIMVYFGSLVFAYSNDRTMLAILPVKWSEKALFMIVYSLVVVPLCVDVPQILADRVAIWLDPDRLDSNVFLSAKYTTQGVSASWNYLQQLIPAAVCLTAVVFYTSRRILMPVVWTIVSVIGLSVLGGICGILSVVKLGASNLDVIAESNKDNPKAIINALMGEMQPYISILQIISVSVLIILAWLVCRRLKTGQL